jgi:hypothetical protein
MRKFFIASAALVAFAAPAFASGSAELAILADIGKKCTVTTSVAKVNISGGAGSANVIINCNFVGSVSGTTSSLNGGLLSETGAGTLYQYFVQTGLIDGGAGPVNAAKLQAEAVAFNLTTTGTTTTVPVNVTWPDFNTALADGYKDILTFTVSP